MYLFRYVEDLEAKGEKKQIEISLDIDGHDNAFKLECVLKSLGRGDNESGICLRVHRFEVVRSRGPVH